MSDGYTDPTSKESNLDPNAIGMGVETKLALALDSVDDEDGNMPLIYASAATLTPSSGGKKKKGFGMRSKLGAPSAQVSGSSFTDHPSSASSTTASTTPTEVSKVYSGPEADTLLSQHRAAVHKVLADRNEQAIEAIMQQLSSALQANKAGENSPKSPKPQGAGKKKGNQERKRDNLDRIDESANSKQTRQEEKDKSADRKAMLNANIGVASLKLGIGSVALGAQGTDGDQDEDKDDKVVEIKHMKPHGIFADADAMKAQLREAMARPAYDVQNFYWETGVFQAIARHSVFENLTLFVISFNAIWIAVDVDSNPADVINDAPAVFIVMDNFFCIYFLFEILIRFGAFQNKRNCLMDRWFMFDSFMCGLMIFETWFLCIMFAIGSSGGGGGVLGDASLLKGIRLIRLVRMARMLRLLNSMPELMVLIKGMRVAFRAVSCTVALLLLIIYVFAVAMRQITDDTPTGRRDFPSVWEAAKYLTLQGTMPDIFQDAGRIWDENWLFALVFMLFILVVSITVMNMLVGILVGVVNTVSQVEKEQLMVQFVKTNLLQLMTSLKIDEDGDGYISRREFDQLIQQPAAINSFQAMNVDVVGLVDLADFIFKDDRSLPFGEFMEVIMELRGSNQATVKDIVDLRKCVMLEMHQIRIEMHALNEHALMLHGHDEDAVAISIPKSNQFVLANTKNLDVEYDNDNEPTRSFGFDSKEDRKKKTGKVNKQKNARSSMGGFYCEQ